MKNNDLYYMKQALNLANIAEGQTLPNPMVGALIVKGNKVLSSGFHKQAGKAHAEVIALKRAGTRAKNATLYVTLEPCVHFGRTPPCTEAIIKAGIKKVIIAMSDPNPINSGKGIKILKQHGIKVKNLKLKQAQYLNKVFIKYITKRMPYVTVKIAQSLDGKIATRTGQSKWITSQKARKCAHDFRKKVSAIIIGINTLLKDNPLLTTRENSRQPIKVILDARLKTKPGLNIFSKKSPALTIIATAHAQKNKFYRFKHKNVRFLTFNLKNGKINLKQLLRKLAALEISHVLIEGGASVIGSAFDSRIVDEVMVYLSPKIIGGKDALSAVAGEGVSRLDNVCVLKNTTVAKIGTDFLIRGDVQ